MVCMWYVCGINAVCGIYVITRCVWYVCGMCAVCVWYVCGFHVVCMWYAVSMLLPGVGYRLMSVPG